MYKGRNGVHTRVLSADRNVQGAALCMSTAARGSGGISLQAGHQSSGGACSAHGARSILWLTCGAPTLWRRARRLPATVPGTTPFCRAAPSVRGQRRQVVLEGVRSLQRQPARRQQRSAGRPCRRSRLAPGGRA